MDYSEVSQSSPTGDQGEAEDGLIARNDASNRVVANLLRDDSAGGLGQNHAEETVEGNGSVWFGDMMRTLAGASPLSARNQMVTRARFERATPSFGGWIATRYIA